MLCHWTPPQPHFNFQQSVIAWLMHKHLRWEWHLTYTPKMMYSGTSINQLLLGCVFNKCKCGSCMKSVTFIVISNEPFELGMSNLVSRYIINILTNCVWSTVYKSTITNMVVVHNFEVVSSKVNKFFQQQQQWQH